MLEKNKFNPYAQEMNLNRASNNSIDFLLRDIFSNIVNLALAIEKASNPETKGNTMASKKACMIRIKKCKKNLKTSISLYSSHNKPTGLLLDLISKEKQQHEVDLKANPSNTNKENAHISACQQALQIVNEISNNKTK